MLRQHTVTTPYNVGNSHFYSAEIAGELVMFDTGPPTEQGWKTLCSEVDLKQLKHVFITHWHVDHCGLTSRIQEESDAVVYLSRIDALKQQHQSNCLEPMASLLKGMGFDDTFLQQLFELGSHAGLFSESVTEYQVLDESDVPARLGIDFVECAGHCQSDTIYRVGDKAISGDILLPDFFQTPLLEIDLISRDRRFDNYSAYCSSLTRFRQLRGAHVHPGHRQTFRDLDPVIGYYVCKLRERAKQIQDLPADMSVREIIEHLFGGLMEHPVITFLKASEIAFMQDYLAHPERLECALSDYGHFDVADSYLSETNKHATEVS